MTTATATPNLMDQLAAKTPSPTSTPNSGPNIFDQLAAGTYKDPNAAPEISDDEKASNIRQMMVSGMTGLPTPNMTDSDRASFEKGKVVGAISVPAVAAAYLGAHSALAAGIPALTKALTAGAISLGEWAAEHPIAAKIIYHGIGAAITGTAAGAGAKVAGKVIKSTP